MTDNAAVFCWFQENFWLQQICAATPAIMLSHASGVD